MSRFLLMELTLVQIPIVIYVIMITLVIDTKPLVRFPHVILKKLTVTLSIFHYYYNIANNRASILN